MSNTFWFLDVDGPINASRAGWGRGPARRHVTDSRGETYRLAWEPELIGDIRSIYNTKLAHIVWCTTWCPDAHLLENLWGLPRLARAWTEYPSGGYVGDLKLNAVREALKAGKRVVWTDDTETPTPTDNPALYEELMSTGRALLIQPSSSRGLRPHDIQMIADFCRENG